MISIDVGYGNTKVFNGESLSAFPSIYYRCKPTEDLRGTSSDMIIETEDGKYHVGMGAFLIGGSAPFDKRDMFRHKIFMLTAIAQATKGDFEDSVVLGLPIVDYEAMSPELKKLKGEYNIVFNGKKRKINIKSVKVCRQGESVFHYLQKINDDIDNEVVGIVDIGQKTVDVAWFNMGQYDPNRSGSFTNLGCLSAYTDIAKALSIRKDMEIEPFAVRKYIKDVPEEAEEAFRFMSEAILRKLENLQWNYHVVDKVVLVGGGADYLKDYMPAQEKIEVMENGAFANARSYYECEV